MKKQSELSPEKKNMPLSPLPRQKRGFTLLEVLVAFSILAILLTVILQSQAETAFFLEKTGRHQLVQRVVMNELSVAERSCATTLPSAENGVFPDDHVLAGNRWQLEVKGEMIMGMIPVTRITYRVSWENPRMEGDHTFESSIFCGR